MYTKLLKQLDLLKKTEFLNVKILHKIRAYYIAHVCISGNQNIKFNTYAVEAILDTGYSTTILRSKKDCITYKKASA